MEIDIFGIPRSKTDCRISFSSKQQTPSGIIFSASGVVRSGADGSGTDNSRAVSSLISCCSLIMASSCTNSALDTSPSVSATLTNEKSFQRGKRNAIFLEIIEWPSHWFFSPNSLTLYISPCQYISAQMATSASYYGAGRQWRRSPLSKRTIISLPKDKPLWHTRSTHFCTSYIAATGSCGLVDSAAVTAAETPPFPDLICPSSTPIAASFCNSPAHPSCLSCHFAFSGRHLGICWCWQEGVGLPTGAPGCTSALSEHLLKLMLSVLWQSVPMEDAGRCCLWKMRCKVSKHSIGPWGSNCREGTPNWLHCNSSIAEVPKLWVATQFLVGRRPALAAASQSILGLLSGHCGQWSGLWH